MTRTIKWFGTVLKYVIGVVCWMVVLGVLQFKCLFNVGPFVDSLWMKDLHDGLVKNVIGRVAFRADDGYGDYGCGAKYIYSVRYRAGHRDGEGEFRRLSSLVDVATWRMAGREGIIVTYLDKEHKYLVRSISDGVDITAEDR